MQSMAVALCISRTDFLKSSRSQKLLADWVSVQAKEHGILDTLKAVIHTLEVPLADGGAVGTQSGVAAEVELI